MKDKVKEFRDKHPWLDAIAGFIPYVGEAQDMQDFAHAVKKQDMAGMSWALLGLAIPGLAGGQLKKLAKFGDDIAGGGIKKAIKAFSKSSIEIPKGYTFLREQELRGPNGTRTVHLVKDNNGKVKILEDLKFKSDLDWSKNWFEAAGRKYKDGSPTQYTNLDVKKLESHKPEYIEIERKAKADGTWLKMPDGSIWEGDPRSWVQLKSQAAQRHNPEVFYTGIRKEIDPNYNEQLWGLPVLNQAKLSSARARTYVNDDSKVFPMFTRRYIDPEQVFKTDAKGAYWQAIKGKNKEYLSTDDIVRDNSKKKVVKINNVIDIGDKKVPKRSKHYHNGIGNDESIPQNNIILQPRTFRKSLIGNNGDFKHPTNIFRGLIPLTLIGYALNETNKQ